MDRVHILDASAISGGFIPKEYLPQECDEWYLRNQQFDKANANWRNLKSQEVETLVRNGNYCANWDKILVTDEFDSTQLRNNELFGFIRIGRCKAAVLEHHDLMLPVGITNSRIVSCDIGDDAAIHDVRYLAHYIIGDRCMLANIDEMHTTNHAKFGNGIIKDGEPEEVRVTLNVMNETGSRAILPFDGMTSADAYIWAKYRDDTALQAKLKEITQKSFDSRRGYYSTLGEHCVIKTSRILKDVKIGSHCYIKGANKLKNLTINSSKDEQTQIGEGVELVNGIIGFGCHIFYGCKAVRFILGNNSNLKYGARLINSYLGDNSTISCCEVLNNLIFPAHEQHHNNSFLIASVVLGQSNIAAGATIGSNHNSRANDNEIQAGRGFWPGLCVSLKHSCRFASFVLIAKEDYPAELDIPFAFSLINNNIFKNRIEIIPAYWWLYDMYALARNSWKYQVRDIRKVKTQNIEFNALAPDTAEEIIQSARLLEIYTAKAKLRKEGKDPKNIDTAELIRVGKELLCGPNEALNGLEVIGENIEKSTREAVILKAAAAYKAYKQMLHYYAVTNLMEYLQTNSDSNFDSMVEALAGKRITQWANIGGQLMPQSDADNLRADIGTGRLNSWEQIHQRYNELWQKYPLDKQKHAWAVLCELTGEKHIDRNQWLAILDEAVEIQEYIRDKVYDSRNKDYENPFRKMTYRNIEEMTAAIGTIEDNDFVQMVRKQTEQFRQRVETIKQRR
ncbi:MAG: DUF4954 family protein [Phycisphaerae bacterium]